MFNIFLAFFSHTRYPLHMYIRQAKIKRSGRTYLYQRLIESVRTPNGPRQRLIMSLGTLSVPKSEWHLLAQRIEDFLKKQESLPFGSYPVDELAKKFAERIERKQLKKQRSRALVGGEVKEVYVDETSVDQARELGPGYVGHAFWKRLEMERILKEIGFTEKQCRLSELQVVGRLVSPRSELGTVGWFGRTALDELMGSSFGSGMNEDLLYRLSDKLYEKREEIEVRLAQRERELFSLDETIILYDLTSTYFEGLALGNEKARHGYSRDHRPDQKQVVIGLVLDREGFPKAHAVFEGNKRDPETLGGMLDTLENRIEEKKVTVVMDRGLATEENLEMIRGRGHTYIVATRQSEREKLFPKVDENQFEALGEDQECEVQGQVRRLEDEVVVLCYSKKREAKDRAIRERFQKRFEEDAEKLKRRVATDKLKNEQKINQAIGRLKERYPRVARYYDLELNVRGMGQREFQWALREENVEKAEQLDGMYVLRTNRLELTDKEIWSLYVMLTRVERSFRYLKSTLGIRPVFHQKASRVESHIFISLLAYHLLHAIERQLQEHGDTRSWQTINDILSTHVVVTITYQATDGTVYKIRRPTRAEYDHELIYSRLGLGSTPLKGKRL
jgi:transposase